jgi:exo-beta-1,3-glucanase (GH17 family)
MHKAVSLFTLAAATIMAVWWWLGSAVPMPPSPLDKAEKLYCVSYAPFRGRQSPLDLSTRIEAAQIDEDLKRLSALTDCVRVYSVDSGLENVPEIAQRHGLKVLLGAWVSGHRDRTEYQIRTTVALAKRFPDTIRAVIVGNEALLRGEIAPDALAQLIAEVKSQVTVPVSYADVWEFWVRNRQLADVADFVTVHILPYWEDHPVAAGEAAGHVDTIRKHVVETFPGREIVIGEVGWPSAGRMRDDALPSPANQARVLHDILERGKREGFRVNIIEAFDQPWKRYQEGTVGGHWGLMTDPPRQAKFVWGEPVSNHPFWPWQAAFGVLFAAAIFAVPRTVHRQGAWPDRVWFALAGIAVSSGISLGWTLAAVPVESLGPGGWIRSIALSFLALAVPLACAAALASGVSPPGFAAVIGPAGLRVRTPLRRTLGWLLVALFVVAMETALGLSFDPRYRDFPFAPLTSAVVPFLLLGVMTPRQGTGRLLAETVGAAVLAAAAAFIVLNEGLANWQAVWTACALAALSVTLARVRAAPG